MKKTCIVNLELSSSLEEDETILKVLEGITTGLNLITIPDSLELKKLFIGFRSDKTNFGILIDKVKKWFG